MVWMLLPGLLNVFHLLKKPSTLDCQILITFPSPWTLDRKSVV